MKRVEALPRGLHRPGVVTIAEGAALAELVLRQRDRMNGEDRALVEHSVIDALHRIVVAEYRRSRDGATGARRLSGCRGEGPSSSALARAVLAYAEVTVDPSVVGWLAAEFLVCMRHAVGRGYAVWIRGEKHRRSRARRR